MRVILFVIIIGILLHGVGAFETMTPAVQDVIGFSNMIKKAGY